MDLLKFLFTGDFNFNSAITFFDNNHLLLQLLLNLFYFH